MRAIFFIDQILNKMWVFQYLAFYAILKLKSSDDILQGLNKLESIVRLSKFQIFKERDSSIYLYSSNENS
jgi:hypothetical protein